MFNSSKSQKSWQIFFLIFCLISVVLAIGLQFFTYSQNSASLKQIDLQNFKPKPTMYQTVVDNYTFSYSSEEKTIQFEGKVLARNSCITLQKAELSDIDGNFILNIYLNPAKKGQMCLQVLRNIPVQGSLKVALSTDQLNRFDSLFSTRIDAGQDMSLDSIL